MLNSTSTHIIAAIALPRMVTIIATGFGHQRVVAGKDLAVFVNRVEAMTAAFTALPKPAKTKAGTLLALIEEYRGRPDRPGKPAKAPSPEWSALAPATRRSYDRILDPETGYLRRATNLQPDQIALHTIDRPNVVRFRNKVAEQFGFWTGNYTVKVLRPLFEWAFCTGI